MKDILFLLVNADIWLGLSSETKVGTPWNLPRSSGLIMVGQTGWFYADGSPYNPTVDYKFGYDTTYDMVGPCMYLKASAGFGPKKAVCLKTYAFMCRHTGTGDI